jgi:hypothetical protein
MQLLFLSEPTLFVSTSTPNYSSKLYFIMNLYKSSNEETSRKPLQVKPKSIPSHPISP